MQGFDSRELLIKFHYPILILLVGLILIGGGYFFYKSEIWSGGTKVEVLGTSDLNSINNRNINQEIVIDITGEVIKPGVYKLPIDSRVNDLLVVSGGFTIKADREWSDKYLNRAAKLTDGQKVYIPSVNSQSITLTANKGVGDQTISSPIVTTSKDLVNINTASASELDSLPGIGQIYGQKIIEQRPYSKVEELVSKGVLKQSLYDKLKDLITIY